MPDDENSTFTPYRRFHPAPSQRQSDLKTGALILVLAVCLIFGVWIASLKYDGWAKAQKIKTLEKVVAEKRFQAKSQKLKSPRK
jgi:hypothetical protein